MPRIFSTKSSFFGFGKSETSYKDYCDKCNVELISMEHLYRTEDKDEAMFCKSCAIQLNIELEPHSWPSDKKIIEYDTRDFFIDVEKKEKIIYSCVHCDGLLVATKEVNRLNRRYYKVGNENYLSQSFKCRRESHSSRLEGGHVKKMLTCSHSFVTVASTRNNSIEAHKKFNELTEKTNSILVDMYGHINYEAVAFGRKYIWCKKCGLYYQLTPSQERELQAHGINKDWYL